MNLGHLSDVHISSRQHAYRGKRATVIPGVDADPSPPVAEVANNNADNFFSLPCQAAQGSTFWSSPAPRALDKSFF